MIKMKSWKNNTNEFMLVVCFCLKYLMESQQQDNKQHLPGGRNKKNEILTPLKLMAKLLLTSVC